VRCVVSAATNARLCFWNLFSQVSNLEQTQHRDNAVLDHRSKGTP
jgi:hypothetical protein